ncbi:polysaccharide pyruvyl transferase family protein [Gracilibacillus lacisalsi]|uniref:polysaccharide pyruvyl transferase family protein n=1 Tax=Gracilibacillus lacisalsi TaxID=393087 RepID=UPI000379E19F|nr:polysaccharide pyruvyl transferase family protein [Gracilibacillus lacisalsi]
MNYLILSSYFRNGTRNSGDALITTSLEKILYNLKGNHVNIDIVYLKEKPRIAKLKTNYAAILSPSLRITVEGEKVAPTYRNEYMDFALKHDIPVYVIGAGWKQYPGTKQQSLQLPLAQHEQKLFQLINKNKGLISTRDVYTENVLEKHQVSSVGTTGDLGLFDTDLLNTPPKLPKNISTIAISLPHNFYHFDKCREMARYLIRQYDCPVKICCHGYADDTFQQISQKWPEPSIEIVDLSGGANKLDFYKDIDLHVGFRLHAHIWFLRNRKPSLLLAEDGRSTGHLETISGLGYSVSPISARVFSEFFPIETDQLKSTFQREEPTNAMYQLLEDEITSGFKATKNSLVKIDALWQKKMKPMLDLIP